MNAQRHREVMDILGDLIERAPAEQDALLAQVCQGDSTLRREVERLLGHQVRAADFLEESPLFSATRDEEDDEASQALVGKRVGAFTIIKEIGRGGMGAVYLAQRADKVYEQRVAVKIIKRGMDTDAVIRRFRNERQILAHLEHPNIARLIDGGTTDDGLPYFVMELVEGLPVNEYAEAHDLSITERLELFRTICAAVQYAHQNLIIHRDIKPSNILVNGDGVPKLLDFGIAKLLHSDSAAAIPETLTQAVRVMTPEYASPEQIRGVRVTTATDIYSLGVTLYELLTGLRPYRTKTRSAGEMAEAICEQEPEKPSLAISRAEKRETPEILKAHANTDAQAGETQTGEARGAAIERLRRGLRGDVDNILLMALRKDATRRYASVGQFSEDIRRHLAGLPVIARQDTFAYRASKFVKRNKLAVSAAAVVLLMLIGGIVAIAWEAHAARRERARAERRFNDVRRMADSFMFELNDEIQKGPTKARAMLVKKALEYLDGLSQEAGNDRSLQRDLATAYAKVGDIQGQPYNANLGDTAGALASYRKAQGILESLSASEPKNPDVLRSLCLVYKEEGWLQVRAGDCDAALESGRKEVTTAESLLAITQPKTEHLRLLASGYLVMGMATYRGGRSESVEENRRALESFRQALAIDEKLNAADPTNAQISYAVSIDSAYAGYALWKLGELTGDVGNYRAASDNFRKNREIAEALYASEPDKFRRMRADALMDFGREQLKLGDAHGGLETCQQALSIFEKIAAADADNIEAQRDVADGHRNISDALMKTGDITSALAHSRKALAIYEALQNSDPTSTENQFSLVQAYNEIGESLDKMKQWSEAQNNRLKARPILEKLSKTGSTLPQANRWLAIEVVDIAKEYQCLASNAQTPADKRQESWRLARVWYQQGLMKWQEMRDAGTLNDADANRPVEVSRELAVCDEALSR